MGDEAEAQLQNVEAAVAQLQSLSIHLRDNQPSISSASVNVDYDVSFDTNFVDRVAFASGVSKYVEEAQKHAALVCKSNSCL